MTAVTDTSTTAGKIADLESRLAESRIPAGEEAVHKVHAQGRITSRAMVESLVDDGSFVEIDALARHRSTYFGMEKDRPTTDGIISGHGTVDGRPVCIFAQDASVFDGQIGEVAGDKIVKVLELALKSGTPVIGIYEGAGARTHEGIVALEALSRVIRLQAQASGVIPQIAVVNGPTTGALAQSVTLSDVVIEVGESGHLQLSEEDTVSTVLDATAGTSQLNTPDQSSALDAVADILSYLPSNNRATAPLADAQEATDVQLDQLIPDSGSEAYDIRVAIDGIVDESSVLELGAAYAPNLITAFCRVHGESVGLLANQPLERAGALDTDAAEKAARFIRLCDAFNVPLLNIIDVPGYLPDDAGDVTVRRAAKLLAASATASVGKLAVVTRKAYGAAYIAMGAKRMGTDLVFAWPTAEIAVADAETMAEELGQDHKEIAEKLVNPYEAASRGLVDAVIPPSETRAKIAEGIRLLGRKVEDSWARKHDTVTF